MWNAIIPILNWFSTAIGAATIGSWFVSQDTATQQDPSTKVTLLDWFSRRSMTMKVIVLVAFGVLIWSLYKKIRK